MTTPPFVDVIIPHLNDRDRLMLCLEDLAHQSYPRERYSITVVDNGSDQPIDDLVARFPGVQALYESERGCGSARNRGVQQTSGDILAFTDSDCRPERDWLTNGVRMLSGQAGQRVDIVGGEISLFAVDERNPTDAELFDKVFGFECRRYVERKHFAAGANIMVTRRTFNTIGPFLNGSQPEDLEWGRRATGLGFRIGYAPEVCVRHPARHTMLELRKKAERTSWHARNHMATQSWFRLRWGAYTLAMASPPLLKSMQVLRSPALRMRGQKARALRTLFSVRYFRVGVMVRYLFAAPPRSENEV